MCISIGISIVLLSLVEKQYNHWIPGNGCALSMLEQYYLQCSDQWIFTF